MIIIGFGGQALFATRFIIQWLSSENAGRSVIPVAFWYFFYFWRTSLVDICYMEARSSYYCWAICRCT